MVKAKSLVEAYEQARDEGLLRRPQGVVLVRYRGRWTTRVERDEARRLEVLGRPVPGWDNDEPRVDVAAESERLCQCGAPLPARRRLCDACRDAERRETYKASKRRQRAFDVHS